MINWLPAVFVKTITHLKKRVHARSPIISHVAGRYDDDSIASAFAAHFPAPLSARF